MPSRYLTWSIEAEENFTDFTPGTGSLFKAISLKTGKFANDGLEAGGILIYGGRMGEMITLGYHGVMKFVAGSKDIEKGEQLTVIAGGYFIPATPGTYIVGRCLDQSVKAGQIGTGVFNFATIPRMQNKEENPSEKLTRIASIKMVEMGILYSDAVEYVLKTNPTLAKEYRESTLKFYNGAPAIQPEQ